MNVTPLAITAILTVLSLGAGVAVAGDKAKIEQAAAEKIALARVPGGEIKESELETEHVHVLALQDVARLHDRVRPVDARDRPECGRDRCGK